MMTSPSGAAVDAVREQVKQYFETHITDARDGAVHHLRQVEATAVDTVEATADRVTGPHVEATRLDREATADHVVEAGGHAQDAAASAGLAAQHAEGVSHAEARAGEHEDLARGHEDEARVQAEASAGHADRSDGHAVVSQGWADSSATSAALSLVAAATVTQYVGDGFPEGKVAAPVGSIYTDRQATAGAVRWIKTTGTGNTGWKVEYGDTGQRVITHNGAGGTLRIQRVGDIVTIGLNEITLEEGRAAFILFAVPYGFRPADRTSLVTHNPRWLDIPSVWGSYNGLASNFSWLRKIDGSLDRPTIATSGTVTFFTDNPWPSTLPGVPA